MLQRGVPLQQSTTSFTLITHNTQASTQQCKRCNSSITEGPNKRIRAAEDIYFDSTTQDFFKHLFGFVNEIGVNICKAERAGRRAAMLRRIVNGQSERDSEALEVDEGPEAETTNNEAPAPDCRLVRSQTTRSGLAEQKEDPLTNLKGHIDRILPPLETAASEALKRGRVNITGIIKGLRELETTAKEVVERQGFALKRDLR